MAENALEQAAILLEELIENARQGQIVPFRLPGQLEEIAQALEQGREAANAPSAPNLASTAAADEAGDFMAEQAAFISHAVHELRTPMTSIRGYADMMGTPGMGDLTAMQKQFLETIRTNARRMEGLLMDVSDISKIRGQALKIAAKMDMYKNIVLTVEKQTRPLAEEMGRTLTFETPQGLPILNVDGELFAKALVKLVENALRYHDGDGGEVKVSAVGEGKFLRVMIQDNGIGMTPGELERLGTIYFRGESEAVLAHKGSGLGVPIAYGLIEALDGSVSVISEPGQGTTFTVTLTGMT
ncbi:MAG: HAMP domain-containing histidine kinase [Anaerolineaceae bacterium]|nr:HAMP domain-containing histidine kinase [Anaerolineaceae bacterium]